MQDLTPESDPRIRPDPRIHPWTAKMAGKSYRSNAWGAGYDKSVCPRQKALTNQAALVQ